MNVPLVILPAEGTQMFLTEVGFSSFETADPPSGFAGVLARHGESNPAVGEPTVQNASGAAVRSVDSLLSSGRALATIATRLLAVTAVVGVSLLLHVVALGIAERTYAPYRVSRSGEYVQTTTATVVAQRSSTTAASNHQLPRRP